MNNKNSYLKTMKVYRIIILFWTLFIGVGALCGGTCMLIKPDGSLLQMNSMLVYFEKLPLSEVLFKNYIFPGIALIIVNGISNITAALLIIKNKRLGYILGYIFGITLMLWICIQFYMFAPNIYAIDVFFFIFGLLQFIFGYLAYVNFMQLAFYFDINEYKDIDFDNHDDVVIYFSRMGYTKKIAYEKANRMKCGIYEIKSKEKIHGILGFWWCGRFGMHRWPMNIDEINIKLDDYKNIHLLSSMWVFHVASPMLKYINENVMKLHNVHMTLVHYQPITYNNEFDNIESIIKQKLLRKESICSQKGIVKFKKSNDKKEL